MKLIQENVYSLRYNGRGDGSGNGNGNGEGRGGGIGSGNGNGNGYGDAYGNGDGFGYAYGSGNGSGYGNGYGDGKNGGYGDGYGSGIYLLKFFGEWFEVSGKIENSLCYNIPKHLYHVIDKEFISKVDNLESLRILREKIGIDKYIELLDAIVINREIDNQGNEMKLYKYNEKGLEVLLLEVICPSTGRMYHIYPPTQKAKNCFEAKASTFDNKPIAVRHGDVGFVKVGNKFIIPFSET